MSGASPVDWMWCACWQVPVDYKAAMVPLPGSPEPGEALPLGGNWMEHGLKEDAGPKSPNDRLMVEEGGPKVCLLRSGASLHSLLFASLASWCL